MALQLARRLEPGSINLYIAFGIVAGLASGVIVRLTGLSPVVVAPVAAAISSLLAGIATNRLTGTRDRT